MKNRLYIGILLALGLCSSCGDFFEASSQDEIIPTTVEDMRSVCYAEAYPYLISTDCYLNLLTDEIQCNGLQADNYATALENGTPVFTFNPMMFDGTEVFPDDVNSWKTYYENIMGCNVIIDHTPEVKGSEQDKNALIGQALLLRGFYYLKLAMIYCQPYNAPGVDPETAMGVPLMLTMEMTDDFPARSSLAALYSQIETDLLEAARLLKENYEQENVYRVDHVTAYILLSRLYLYRGGENDLDKAIEYAGLAIEEGPRLTRFTSFYNTEGQLNGFSIYDDGYSSEIVWCYGGNSSKSSYYFPGSYGETFPWTVSNSLLGKYDTQNDLRYAVYFIDNLGGGMRWNKIGYNSSYGGDHGVRMAEAYLNRAEAAIRKGGDENLTQALRDLNDLRETRWASGTYVDEPMMGAEDLLAFCLEERQRELCLEEGFRWFDIKRLGLSVTHNYIDAEGVERECVLESNSPLYALPIPYDAINRNYNLRQNPR